MRTIRLFVAALACSVTAVGLIPVAASGSQPTVPSSPLLTEATAYADQIHVAWSAPSSDGGSPLIGYTVTAQPGGVTFTTDATQHELNVTGLISGTEYTVAVSAQNSVGSGPQALSGPVLVLAMTRVDVDPAGVADTASDSSAGKLSGDGHYLLIYARTNSNLVPEPYRTPDARGYFLLRKDLWSGEIIVAGLDESGNPIQTGWYSDTIDWDGQVFAYARFTAPHTVFVRDLVAGTVTPIPWSSQFDWNRPILSGDGRWLAWYAGGPAQASRTLLRSDWRTGTEPTKLLDCPDGTTGCYIASDPVASEDLTTYVFEYRRTSSDPILLVMLNADTGNMTTLPESSQGNGYAISRDGQWIFYVLGTSCPSCGGSTLHLKKIATTPNAVPVEIRSWDSSGTWAVAPRSADNGGRLISYLWQMGGGGPWRGATPAMVYDQASNRELQIPQARPKAFLTEPLLSGDGATAIVGERCLWGENCYPVGIYAVALSDWVRPPIGS